MSEHGHDHRYACVSRVPLFADLSDADRHDVADLAMTRHYRRGEQVHRPGDESGLRIVHGGRVKVHHLSESGAEQLIRILQPGEFLGETTLLTGEPVDTWAVALEDSEVCSLGRREVDGLLREHPDVALRMLATVSRRLGDAEQLIASITHESVARRLVDHLLELATVAGSSSFRLPSTKRDLASYLGTTPETLSRRLRALRDAGLLRLGPRGQVEILDAGRLRRAVPRD